MARKTFNEKLNDSKDMPKIIKVTDERSVERYGGEDMLIAPPLEYNEIMAKIPEGKLITITEIREFLAKKHNAEFTCPLTAEYSFHWLLRQVRKGKIIKYHFGGHLKKMVN